MRIVRYVTVFICILSLIFEWLIEDLINIWQWLVTTQKGDHQLTVTIIGTFVGFLLVMLGGRIIEHVKEEKERQRLKENLMNEIDSIYSNVDKVELRDKDYNRNFYLDYLKVLIWEGLINTSKLALISNDLWFKDLANLYSYVREYNKWHVLRSELFFLTSNILSSAEPTLNCLNKLSIRKVDNSENFT